MSVIQNVADIKLYPVHYMKRIRERYSCNKGFEGLNCFESVQTLFTVC